MFSDTPDPLAGLHVFFMHHTAAPDNERVAEIRKAIQDPTADVVVLTPDIYQGTLSEHSNESKALTNRLCELLREKSTGLPLQFSDFMEDRILLLLFSNVAFLAVAAASSNPNSNKVNILNVELSLQDSSIASFAERSSKQGLLYLPDETELDQETKNDILKSYLGFCIELLGVSGMFPYSVPNDSIKINTSQRSMLLNLKEVLVANEKA